MDGLSTFQAEGVYSVFIIKGTQEKDIILGD